MADKHRQIKSFPVGIWQPHFWWYLIPCDYTATLDYKQSARPRQACNEALKSWGSEQSKSAFYLMPTIVKWALARRGKRQAEAWPASAASWDQASVLALPAAQSREPPKQHPDNHLHSRRPSFALYNEVKDPQLVVHPAKPLPPSWVLGCWEGEGVERRGWEATEPRQQHSPTNLLPLQLWHNLGHNLHRHWHNSTKLAPTYSGDWGQFSHREFCWNLFWKWNHLIKHWLQPLHLQNLWQSQVLISSFPILRNLRIS